MADRLLFIYNVGSSLPAEALSVVKKQFGRPECGLCSITYGVVRKKAAWAEAEKQLPFPVTYYHKNDMPPAVETFLSERHVPLPAVLLEHDGAFSLVAGKEAIDACRGTVACLEQTIKAYFHSVSRGDTMGKDMPNRT